MQIAVYAGGIMVLFVFAILLTRRPDEEVAYLRNHRRAIGATVSVLGGILLMLALLYMPLSHEANLMSCLDGSATISMKEIGKAFTGTEKFQYLLPFEAISILLLACIIGGVTVARKR